MNTNLFLVVIGSLKTDGIMSERSAELLVQEILQGSITNKLKLFDLLIANAYEELPEESKEFFSGEDGYYAVPLSTRLVGWLDKYLTNVQYLHENGIIGSDAKTMILDRLANYDSMAAYAHMQGLNLKYLQMLREGVDL
ncbi:hypothetical protein [uncultured Imperialibacter sp.]|uniref:hypothetical protein n=1 Tax=uncultured Imperialibacter sp. TaxID=1672639 RepID=UPI0030DC882C|tara:strand:+ start:4750 stop:5166 length:417 start_codon:yes stop_codon:yes gene_type:complete